MGTVTHIPLNLSHRSVDQETLCQLQGSVQHRVTTVTTSFTQVQNPLVPGQHYFRSTYAGIHTGI